MIEINNFEGGERVEWSKKKIWIKVLKLSKVLKLNYLSFL